MRSGWYMTFPSCSKSNMASRHPHPSNWQASLGELSSRHPGYPNHLDVEVAGPKHDMIDAEIRTVC